jgi:hypothetical protein
MKLAHVLWLSQTVDFLGNELKSDDYNTGCLGSIGRILRCQKNGNKPAADALHQKIRNALKAKDIEMSQFES